MCVLGVRSRVREGPTEVDGATEKVWSAIAEPRPEVARRDSIKAGDDATFVSREPEKPEEARERTST